ncbi:MAG: hypothetical protein WAT78_02220 [Rhizobiaceae bacterium]
MKLWIFIVGFILLLPGLCGSFFLLGSFAYLGSSGMDGAYAAFALYIAVPSIQLSCLFFWLMANFTNDAGLSDFTRSLGWFGAVTAGYLLLQASRGAFMESTTWSDFAIMGGIGLAVSILPFLIGGLPAILHKQEKEQTP